MAKILKFNLNAKRKEKRVIEDWSSSSLKVQVLKKLNQQGSKASLTKNDMA